MQRPRIARALLVHGAGGGGWEWNVWRGVFEAHGIACHAPDLQPAVRGLPATRLDDYVEQVRTAADALARPRAIVGASLGGLLAIAAADRADALVLVNPLPPAPWTSELGPRGWPDVVPWRGGARFDSTRRALADADEAARLFAFRHWRDESGPVLREAHAGVMLPAPACRTLCIASSDDGDVPPDLTRRLAAAWNARCLEVEAGHVGPLLGRHAGEIAAQAVAFLSAD